MSRLKLDHPTFSYLRLMHLDTDPDACRSEMKKYVEMMTGVVLPDGWDDTGYSALLVDQRYLSDPLVCVEVKWVDLGGMLTSIRTTWIGLDAAFWRYTDRVIDGQQARLISGMWELSP